MRFGAKTHKPLFYSSIYNRRILPKRLTLTLPRLGSRVRIPSPAPSTNLRYLCLTCAIVLRVRALSPNC